MKDKILAIIADILSINQSKLKLKMRFIEDLKFDSLDFASMFYELENEFKLNIDMENFLKCQAIDDIVKYITYEKKMEVKND